MTAKVLIALLACLVASTLASGVAAQKQPQTPAPHPLEKWFALIKQQRSPLPKELTATAIPGVIEGGTKIQLVVEGLLNQESPITMPDGSLLFAEIAAERILKIDANDRVSTYVMVHGHPRGLAYDPKGRLVATLGRAGLVAVVYPTYEVLASSYRGQLLGYPNEIVADSKGGFYFTDPVDSLHGRFRPATKYSPVLLPARR